ncbi:MAG: flap structure-specific endonuclease [Thermoplasmata archaeon]
MGLPFRDIVKPDVLAWEALPGRALAVDGYNAIYQFLATIRQADGHLFTDAEGRPTSHLMGVFYRTTALLRAGIRLAWVFDGKPPDLKAGTLRARFEVKERAAAAWDAALASGDLVTARRKAAATSRLTRPMVDEVKEMLAALGVPCVQAPSEGEAQAAWMAAQGRVWAAASEDYDSLLFGASRLVRGLAARQRRGSPNAAQVIDRERLLKELGVSGEELILVGLIVGTDFNDGAKGFGPKKALKLVQQHLGWNETLRAAGLDPDEIRPVGELFLHPEVVEVPPLEFRPPSLDRLVEILVEGHGFSRDRVERALQRPPAARHAPRATPAGRQTALDGFEGSAA